MHYFVAKMIWAFSKGNVTNVGGSILQMQLRGYEFAPFVSRENFVMFNNF
jgi:hypothetical protein